MSELKLRPPKPNCKESPVAECLRSFYCREAVRSCSLAAYTLKAAINRRTPKVS